jgi:hypothetical protein
MDVARALSDPVLIGEATFGLAGGTYALWWLHYGQVDEDVVRLLDEALEALPGEDRALRVRVMATLARQLYSAKDFLERRLA